MPGKKDYEYWEICKNCKGNGNVTINNQANDVNGPEMITCSYCGGAGKILVGYIIAAD